MAMAQIELDSCPDDDRAIELWQRAPDSDTPTVAAQAWLSLGRIQQYSAPITAARLPDRRGHRVTVGP